uniref:organic cation transporter protein-like n=1 Tax=Styela clava TaxID=7725 RepID=UPI001939883B|nr:organic cation transporter protein-like [Styela clava]
MAQSSVFFSAVPYYRCSVPPLDDPRVYPNLTEENITNLLIPPGEQCFRYDYNLSTCTGDGDLSCLDNPDPGKIQCDNGYTYDDTYYEETTVSEWDLVCGRTTLDSVAIAMYYFGVMIGAFLAGPLLDWFGRKVSMLIFAFIILINAIVTAFSPSYGVYIGMRTLTAIGNSAYLCYFTYVSEMVDKKSRTPTTVGAMQISALAHTCLPGFAYFLRDWRKLCLCLALINVSYIFVYFFIPRSCRWLLTNNKAEEAKITVQRIARCNKIEFNDDDWNLVVKTEKEILQMSQKKKKYFMYDLYRPTMMRFVSINIIYLWFVVAMIFYGLTLNVRTLVGDPYVNAAINALVEFVGYFVFYAFAGPVGMRITSSISYFLGGMCCITTMLLLQFANGNQAMLEASRWVAILGKLFASTSFAVVYQYTAELYPTVVRGTGLAMGSMAGRLGPIIMPFTLQLQQTIPWLTQTIFGTLAIIAGATSLLLPDTTNSDLMTSVDQAENFYRDNMKITARLFGATAEYQSKTDSTTSGTKSDDYNECEIKCDDGKVYINSYKL